MRELNVNEVQEVNGGYYSTCQIMHDGTAGFFMTAGAMIGGATTLGLGHILVALLDTC